MDQAVDGDTVLVAPGTYVENLDFRGKNITVTSSGGAASTIIDGHQNGVVVTFSGGETRKAVINGFTIENAALPPNPSLTATSDGILVLAANPTITNNIITNNRGYGIETEPGNPYIVGNTITNTTTRLPPAQDFGCDYDDGAGIYLSGDGVVAGVPAVIAKNTIENNVGHCEGGGIDIENASAGTVIVDNIIANNQSLGYGGGIYVGNGQVSNITQNLIYNNTAGQDGGGLYLSHDAVADEATGPLDAFITNNTIYGNTIVPNPNIEAPPPDGSQVFFLGSVSQVGFFNNIVYANDSYSAIACDDGSLYLSGSQMVIVDSDVLNAGGPVLGSYCQGSAGFGSIAADPKFSNPANGDFHLLSGSPAIDTGFNAAPNLPGVDFAGNPRIQNATGAGVATVDMGAYEAAGSPDSRTHSATEIAVQTPTVFYGEPVKMTATATDSSSSPLTTGALTFMDQWTPLGQATVDNSGTAAFASSNLAVGTHWLNALFGGNSGLEPSFSNSVDVVVKGFATTTTLTFSPNPVSYGQPVTMTANVSLQPGSPVGTGTPTGTVTFELTDVYDGDMLATVPLSANGTASYSTSSLLAAAREIQANYEPTGGFLLSNSNGPLLVVDNAPTSVALTLSAPVVTTDQPLTVTAAVTDTGSFFTNCPSGTITVTGGGYTSAPAGFVVGCSVDITIPAGKLAPGTDTLTASYSGDSIFASSSGTATISVRSVSGPAFTIFAAPLTVGLGSEYESTITVASSGGFAGTVALAASITSSPSGAQYPPTLSFGFDNVNDIVTVTNSTPGTATLTISTTPVSSSYRVPRWKRAAPWYVDESAALACILLFAVPARRRCWRNLLGLLPLLAFMVAGVLSCGGGGSGGGGGGGGGGGTTAGVYTVTVTGTSGASTATGTVSITVQ